MSHPVHRRVPLTVRLDRFEGPLDLLLYLVQSHELEISKLSISKITDQYLLYVRLMQELDFDLASEFLVMAATLIHWKSKAMLPRDPSELVDAESEEDFLTPDDLIRQMREHQLFLTVGQELSRRPILGLEVFARANAKPPVEKVWREMEVSSIALSIQDLLTRAKRRTQVLRKETVSLTEKIQEMGERLLVGRPTALRDLLSLAPERPEIVVTFLASLELSRLRKMRVHQDGTYEPIYLELLEKLGALDLGLVQTFEHLQEASAP